ncbi:hypothetical protein HispidOSU_013516 [Sigmodon hispidus]
MTSIPHPDFPKLYLVRQESQDCRSWRPNPGRAFSPEYWVVFLKVSNCSQVFCSAPSSPHRPPPDDTPAFAKLAPSHPPDVIFIYIPGYSRTAALLRFISHKA